MTSPHRNQSGRICLNPETRRTKEVAAQETDMELTNVSVSFDNSPTNLEPLSSPIDSVNLDEMKDAGGL